MGRTSPKDRGVSDKRLTDKQRLFCAAYAGCGDATKAALEAGYSEKTAQKQGAVLLKHPLCILAIGKMTKTALDRKSIEASDILEQLFFLLKRDIRDYVDEDGSIRPVGELGYAAAMCVDAVETDHYDDEDGVRHVKTKLKLSPKATAVDLAMKHKGLFAAIEQKVRVSIDWADLLKPTNLDTTVDPIEMRLLEME